MHSWLTLGMTASAIVGALALFVFVTVGWPGDTGRYIVNVMVISGIAFVTFGVLAVFAAARDTYADPKRNESRRD
jgi:hypothetical protein